MIANHKTRFLSVRLDGSDQHALEELCAASGLSASTVVRKLIHGTTIQQRPQLELHELYTAVNRIGNNINQIARHANSGFADANDIVEVKVLMQKLIEAVETVAGR